MASSAEQLRKEVVEFRPTRSRLLAYCSGSLTLAIIGLVIISVGNKYDERLAAAIAVLIFGSIWGIFTRELVVPRACVRLDEEGIHQVSLLTGQALDVGWYEIRSASSEEGRATKAVVIVPVDSENYYARLGPLAKNLAKINAEMIGGPISIGGPIYSVDNKELSRLINERL